MAALNLNKVILVGRMTSDPELKQTQSGHPVTSFTVAVNRKFQKDTEQTADFINCVAWRQTAEFLANHFHKGNSICVVGSIQTRSFTTQNGEKRYITEVVADEVRFVDSKSDNNSSAPAPTTITYIPEAYSTGASFDEVAVDDDLPF